MEISYFYVHHSSIVDNPELTYSTGKPNVLVLLCHPPGTMWQPPSLRTTGINHLNQSKGVDQFSITAARINMLVLTRYHFCCNDFYGVFYYVCNR